MIFVKKESQIEAIQYNGTNEREIDQSFGRCRKTSRGEIWVCDYLLRVGDWVLRDCGITYTMSNSVFEKVYLPEDLEWCVTPNKIESLMHKISLLQETIDGVYEAFPAHTEDSDHLPTLINRHLQERVDAAVKQAIKNTLRQAQGELRSLVVGRSVPELVVLMMASERIGMIGNPERYSTDTDPK
jgi:hypothetical protein